MILIVTIFMLTHVQMESAFQNDDSHRNLFSFSMKISLIKIRSYFKMCILINFLGEKNGFWFYLNVYDTAIELKKKKKKKKNTHTHTHTHTSK